jgi:phage terminase small subunit
MSPKRRRFVLEYIKDLNATQAAIRAGYSKLTADTQGPRLLGNVGVRKAIDSALAEREVRTQIKADDVLKELHRLATVDVGDAFDDMGRLLPFKDMPRDVRRAIAGVDVEELWGPDGGAQLGVIRKVKFWPKSNALEQLGKHLKLFTDVMEVKTDDLTDEQVAARIAALLERARQKRDAGAAEAGKAPVP